MQLTLVFECSLVDLCSSRYNGLSIGLDPIIYGLIDQQGKDLLSAVEVEERWPRFISESRKKGGPTDREFDRLAFIDRYNVLQQEVSDKKKAAKEQRARKNSVSNIIIFALIKQDQRHNIICDEIETNGHYSSKITETWMDCI